MNGARLFLVVLVVVVICACTGSESGIRGKVVDGKGRPLSDVKMIARQELPVKGYDRFETSTASDGSFRFNHLFPASRYALFPTSRAWKTSSKLILQTAREGSTGIPPVLLTVRFTSSDDGVITDSKTGLQWVVGPLPSMSWLDAVRYVGSLSVGGGGWRLPTRKELRDIYEESLEGHVDPAFHINGNWVWTSEAKDDSDAWFFNFENSYQDGHPKEWVLTRGKIVAVRSPR